MLCLLNQNQFIYFKVVNYDYLINKVHQADLIIVSSINIELIEFGQIRSQRSYSF